MTNLSKLMAHNTVERLLPGESGSVGGTGTSNRDPTGGFSTFLFAFRWKIGMVFIKSDLIPTSFATRIV